MKPTHEQTAQIVFQVLTYKTLRLKQLVREETSPVILLLSSFLYEQKNAQIILQQLGTEYTN